MARRLGLVALILCLASPWIPGRAAEPSIAAGFANPESAVWDPATELWYVSDKGVDGLPFVPVPGEGFISTLAADGTMVSSLWLTGFNSPYGLAIDGGTLYVADVPDSLVAVDVASASVKWRFVLPGNAGLPNDVAVDPQTHHVFVSETNANQVYDIVPTEEGATVAQTLPIGSPNGLLVVGTTLFVASIGVDNIDGPTPGGLFAFNLGDVEAGPATIADNIGFLDGIVADGDGFIATDFIYGTLIRIEPTGETSIIAQLLPTAADLGRHGDVLAVPETGENAVVFVDLAPHA